MGVIQRQAIRGSIFAYAGVVIGFVNAILLAPRVLTSEQIGLTSILIAYSLLFVQFSALGFASVISRLFPYFRNEESKHHGFLTIGMIVTLAGFLLALLAFFFLRPVFIRDNIEQSPLFVEYMHYILPLVFFTLLFNLLDNYNRLLFDAVLGTFLNEFLTKVVYFLTLIAFLFKIISFPQFVLLFIFSQSVPAIIILIVLLSRNQISLRIERGFISRKMKKLMINISAFGLLTGLGGVAISTIDRLMINSMIDLSATGIYTVAYYFSVILMIPMRSIRYISTPVIAELMKKKNYSQISSIYGKSSINQLLLGFLIFIGIWANINSVFKILPPEYEAGKYVILFMMLSKLLEMATGVSSIIIVVSRYYRIQMYLMAMLILIVIGSNLIFIPKYGITGAAVASAISAFIFNLSRFLFLYWKYKMQPFSYKVLILILITIVSYIGGYYLPAMSNFIVDILFRSVLISVIFIGLSLLFRVSEELMTEFRRLIVYLGIN